MAEIKLNSDGIRELLRSAGVQADLGRRAAAVAQAAGGDLYGSGTGVGHARARAGAFTRGFKGARHEAKTHALLSALSAARR